MSAVVIAADTPRCARPMKRYEPADWPPVLEDPACARPEGHNGPCRSGFAYRRYLDDGGRRTAARRLAYGRGRRGRAA